MAIQVPASPGASGRSANMRAIRRRDTSPERNLRSELHRRGFRFRVDYPVPVEGSRPPRPDIAFIRQQLAVFVDGCFWHGCPLHSVIPRKNVTYWAAKIARNKERDREHEIRLSEAGWDVIRVWEHDDPAEAADRLEARLNPV